MNHSTHFLSSYIAENTRLVPKAEELSAANQNRARKTLILRQPIRIEHEKPFNFVSQSESSITSPESAANQNRILRHPGAPGLGPGPFFALGSSRLAIAYLNT